MGEVLLAVLALEIYLDIRMVGPKVAGPTGLGFSRIGNRKLVPGMTHRAGADRSVRIPRADPSGPGFVDRSVVRPKLHLCAMTHLAAGGASGAIVRRHPFWSQSVISRFIVIHEPGAFMIIHQAQKLAFQLCRITYCLAGELCVTAAQELFDFLRMTPRTGL